MHALSKADPRLTPRLLTTTSRYPARSPSLLACSLVVLLVQLTVEVARGHDGVVRLDIWVHHSAPAVLTVLPRTLVALVVDLGLRGVTGAVALAYAGWLSRRARSWRPLLVMAGALLSLNVVVGAFKLALGRSSPYQGGPWVFFAGGTEFPSGHASNAVVTWGTMLWLQRRFDARRLSATAGRILLVAITGGVGIGTLLLDTHWLSDVLSGWAVGALLLLALPQSDHLGCRYRMPTSVRRSPVQPQRPAAPRAALAGHHRRRPDSDRRGRASSGLRANR